VFKDRISCRNALDKSLKVWYTVVMNISEVISPSYLVGGSVRDMLMGKEPKDYDFATPLVPDEVEARIRAAGKRVYHVNTGKKYGTLGFKHDGEMVEVTTFRGEEYIDPESRKPSVHFVTDLAEDLSRRDFTINAMALDEVGNIIDPFNGQIDLKMALIRAVGDPYDRFKDDPLRILRAFRFVARYDGFDIETHTYYAIERQQELLYNVSRERWSQELNAILTAPHAAYALKNMFNIGVLMTLLPDLAKGTAPSHYALLSGESLEERWASFIYHSFDAYVPPRTLCEVAEGLAARLRWSNNTKRGIKSALMEGRV